MRILFLTHYYPPEVNAPANRGHEHARLWAKAGHDVTVVTGVPNHPRGEVFPGYRNRWRQEEWMEGVRVVRTWMYVTANEGFFRRTLNYLLFAATALLAALRQERPDVIVATSPQFFCGVAGAVAARLRRVPFVLEVRDLWPDSIVQLGQLRQPTLVRALEALESALYRQAAGIVVVTRAFAEHVAARGIPRERIAVVFNGIDKDRFRPRPPDPELLRAHGLEGRFLVAYVGTLGLAHGLGTVIDAAERMREEPVAFLFVGDGADRERLEAEVARRGLENVHFVGLRPRDEMPAWIASIDVLLVMLRDLPVFKTVIPSKLFEFLAQERPVVMAAPQGAECRRMLDEAEAGLAVDAENAARLADAIREIRRDPRGAQERARRGRLWVEREFSREVLAGRMLDFVESRARRP